jgi:hypothetical protein
MTISAPDASEPNPTPTVALRQQRLDARGQRGRLCLAEPRPDHVARVMDDRPRTQHVEKRCRRFGRRTQEPQLPAGCCQCIRRCIHGAVGPRQGFCCGCLVARN